MDDSKVIAWKTRCFHNFDPLIKWLALGVSGAHVLPLKCLGDLRLEGEARWGVGWWFVKPFFWGGPGQNEGTSKRAQFWSNHKPWVIRQITLAIGVLTSSLLVGDRNISRGVAWGGVIEGVAEGVVWGVGGSA